MDTAATARRSEPADAWFNRLRIKGDFRYRHEHLDLENADNRDRQRIRARTELIARINDQLDVGFGVASGGDDPVSTNQTLGSGASTKDVRLDLAYLKWQTPIDGVTVSAGKFKNPLHRAGGNGLLWDSDLRPEGVTAEFERGGLFATGLGLWVEENSGGDDQFVFGAQTGWRSDLAGANVLLGAGYYRFDNFAGEPVAFDGDPRGNSVDAAGNYLFDYHELELFTELGFDLAGQAVTLFGNYVKNDEADDFDTGYAVGGKVKFAVGPRPWQLGYTYQDLEADAVFALFTDSDFIGGGTDGKGHIFRGSYDLTKAISLGGTLFVNERGGNAGEEEDFNRLMLDIAIKY